ncbi:MAG: hypothetical protein HDR01_14480 [Lachnospiraceae bacterium]|nr:hypothetical protein [Lachnospiraceae bacterium]
MKKLTTLSYTILCLVLLILSYINFSYDVLENVLQEKQKIAITKEETQTNAEFLENLEEALKEKKLDIMYRYVEVEGNDLTYNYYSTQNTNDFIDQEAAVILSNVTYYNFKEAEKYDLTTGIFYVDKGQCDRTVNAIQELGYQVSIDTAVDISGKISVPIFTAIPILLIFMSMIFYALSIGKKTMLRKMEGYTTFDILKEEFSKQALGYVLIALVLEFITIGTVCYHYNHALMEFFGYQVNYILLGGIVIFIGMIFSWIVICSQNKIAYIKGKVPRKGMYVLSMLVMVAFIIFIVFFMTIAIRNVKLCYDTYKTACFMAEKVEGYVTVPIYENSASSDGLEDNYMEFYRRTVDKFQGVLIYSGNYKYDLISGKTMCEEYDQDWITVNENYLELNPVFNSDGEKISLSDKMEENIVDVLIPVSKLNKKEKYAEYIQNGYGATANFIEYDIKNTKVYSYNAAIGNGTYGEIDSPVIIVVKEENLTGNFMLSYCSSDSYFLKTTLDNPYEELKPVLKETGIIIVTPQTPYISSNYTVELEQQKSMLKLYGFQTIFLSIGIVFLIVFSSILFCENYRKKIVSKLIEGYSIVECIKGHIVFKVLIYGISVLGIFAAGKIIMVGMNYYIVVVMFILDIAVTLTLCNKITKRNVYQIVKGEE